MFHHRAELRWRQAYRHNLSATHVGQPTGRCGQSVGYYWKSPKCCGFRAVFCYGSRVGFADDRHTKRAGL